MDDIAALPIDPAGENGEYRSFTDLKELFPDLAVAGHRDVFVAPVQFLAGHLDVLYDLDVAAAAEADAAGVRREAAAITRGD